MKEQENLNEINARYVLDMHEARLERIIVKMFRLLLISWLITVGTNIAWAVYECQYSTELVTIEAQQEADNDSQNYIIGGNYGETDSKDY